MTQRPAPKNCSRQRAPVCDTISRRTCRSAVPPDHACITYIVLNALAFVNRHFENILHFPGKGAATYEDTAGRGHRPPHRTHHVPHLIQKRLFALGGIPLEYEVLDLPDLEAGLPRLRELDCFNVTIPYKAPSCPFWMRWTPRPPGLAR